MGMNHPGCVNRLFEIGKEIGFAPAKRSYGKMYSTGNPDCVWYYPAKGKGQKILRKIAQGDRYRNLPFIAFEVAGTEGEKALRGSIMSLQLTNAAASIIVLIGKSDTPKFKSYLKKLVGRYSYMRLRIWTENDVKKLYKIAMQDHKK